jgi:hypothetical protein
MLSNGFACLVSCRRFTRQNKSKSRLKTIVILMRSRIYVSDLGLLCAKKDLAANDILYMVEELNDFQGRYG